MNTDRKVPRVWPVVAAVLLLGATPRVPGEVLRWRGDPAAVLDAVRSACPGCADAGFLPCGSAAVQYGRGFAPAAMQGSPPRAYLLARAPVVTELAGVLAATPTRSLAAALADALAGLRLVVVDDGWRRARVLAPRGAAAVSVDPAQHACIRDPARSLSCCLGDGPAASGCLPKADPPDVRLEFDDGIAGERLVLRYPIGRGEIRLRRSAPGSTAASLYWCHGWARAGLRPSRTDAAGR